MCPCRAASPRGRGRAVPVPHVGPCRSLRRIRRPGPALPADWTARIHHRMLTPPTVGNRARYIRTDSGNPGAPSGRAESAALRSLTLLSKGNAGSWSLVTARTRDPPICTDFGRIRSRQWPSGSGHSALTLGSGPDRRHRLGHPWRSMLSIALQSHGFIGRGPGSASAVRQAGALKGSAKYWVW